MFFLKVSFRRVRKEAVIPCYAHQGDAGMDLYSCEQRTLEQGEPYLFKLGFSSMFDEGFVGLIQDRSSMGLRGVRTLGGVVDAGYRGEWGVILINLTEKEVLINKGDKIAQVLFLPVVQAQVFGEESRTPSSSRGSGGFGSTGK